MLVQESFSAARLQRRLLLYKMTVRFATRLTVLSTSSSFHEAGFAANAGDRILLDRINAKAASRITSTRIMKRVVVTIPVSGVAGLVLDRGADAEDSCEPTAKQNT